MSTPKVHYYVGNAIEHDETFIDQDGNPISLASATSVVLIVRDQSGNITNPAATGSVVSAAAGTVKATYTYTSPGNWTWQFRAFFPGNVQVSGVKEYPINIEANADG